MKVALVGASGFVGTAVHQALKARGARVICVPAPRLACSTGPQAPPLDKSAIAHLKTVFAASDAVVNAAGMADADRGGSRALFGANGLLPGVIGAAALAAGVQRFVHISSAAVQGDRELLDASPSVHPNSPYAQSKALGERLANLHGPAETVIYRPPGVHGCGRPTTQKLARFSRSVFSAVAAPGNDGTPQALLDNVADAVAFLAMSQDVPPRFVHHPSEGITTAGLLYALSDKEPVRLPRRAAHAGVRVSKALAGHSQWTGPVRRLEVLLFGQQQAPSWLTEHGWMPPLPPDAWRQLGRRARERLQPKRHDRPAALIVASVPEQLRVQYGTQVPILHESGLTVHAAAGASQDEVTAACPPGVIPHTIPIVRKISLMQIFQSALHLRRVARGIAPHITIYGSPAGSLVGALATIGLVRRRIFVVHGLREETLSGRNATMVMVASWVTARLSSDVVFASPSTRQRARWVSKSSRKVHVATPGFIGIVDPKLNPIERAAQRSHCRSVIGVPEGAAVIGFVGRLARDKGICDLVDAMTLVSRTVPGAHLLLLGGRDEADPLPRTVMETIESSRTIHEVGHVSDPTDWYAAMDVFCLPSYREGLPTVLLEAGAHSVPIVATRCTGVIDTLTETEGWLVPVGDVEKLAEALTSALSDASKAEGISARHHGRVLQQYSTTAVRGWWTPFYRDPSWGRR